MKGLYESIIGTNNASIFSVLDEKLANHSELTSVNTFDAGVSYDVFVRWLDEDKFTKLCEFPLKRVRRSTGQRNFYEFMNIKLTDGVLLFRFTKDIDQIKFCPFLTDITVHQYWEAAKMIKYAIPSAEQHMLEKPDKQLRYFYQYFKDNIDEVKKHKHDL